MSVMNDKKPHWSSHLMFILACIGSTIGVGNIWRFPYLAGENGGGTFILVYLISIFAFGLPIFLLEVLAGKALSSSPFKSFEKIKKKWMLFYYINFGIVIILFSYYVVVTGWALGYLSLSMFGVFIPFQQFSNSYMSLFFTIVVLAMLFLIMRLNIKQGLEKINTFLLPLLFFSLILLFYYASTLAGFSKAVEFYTRVDFARMANPSLWVTAISQAIFSLGIGLGILMAYSSYLPKKAELFRSSIAIIAADTTASLIACLVIFGFVFAFAIPPNLGTGLSFEALPFAFQQMPVGWLLMPGFFLLLFTAAITSAVSLTELVICNFQDMFNISRQSAMLWCIVLIGVLMLPSALSYSPLALSLNGVRILDFLNENIIGRFLPLTIFFVIVYIAWGYKDLEKEVEMNLPQWLVRPFMVLARFLLPLFLLGFSILQFA